MNQSHCSNTPQGPNHSGALIVVILCSLGMTLVTGRCAAESAEIYETPPTFNAAAILPPQLAKSPLHTVLPQVPNDGFLNHFTIRSRFGVFEANGRPMLERRVQEIYTLDLIDRQYSSARVASRALGDTAEGLVMGPVRGVEKAYNTLTDTQKLQDTAASIPGGIAGLFKAAANAVSDGATFVYETGKGAVQGNSNSESGSDTWDKAGNAVAGAVGSFTGYDAAKRDLCKKLRIDPYTDNQLLLDEVRRIAGVKSGVGLGGKLLPALYGVPYVGTVNRYTTRAEQVAAYEDPEKIEKTNRKIAAALGLNQSDPNSPFKSFEKNAAYTPMTRTILLANLKRMQGVADIELFLNIAARAPSREVAAFYLFASESLADYHEKEGPLAAIVSQVAVPAGVSRSGELVVPLPVDYLVWTKDAAKSFDGFEQRIKNYKVKRSEVRIAGKASDRAKAELRRMGAEEIKENVGYI